VSASGWKQKDEMPIRLRLTVWYALLLTLIVAAVGAFVVVRLRSDLTESIDRRLQPAAQQIASGYRAEGAQEFHDVSATVLSGKRAAAQVVGADGTVVLRHGDGVGARPLLNEAELGQADRGPLSHVTVRRDAGNGGFRVAARPVTRHGRQVVVVAAESLASVEDSVHRVVVLLVIALPAALLLTAIGGWWLARRALRPVEQMTRDAERIEVESLDERIADPGTRDEVGHLARTLNAMLARIREAVAQQRRLVDDASHELRTPLAAMRSEVDVSLRADDLDPAARAVLESVREEIDRLARTVDDLLTLASADQHGLTLATERVDLSAVVDHAAAGVRAVATRHGVVLDVEGNSTPVAADPERLRHAVGNIVENAVKFSPAGSAVTVRTTGNGVGARVTVSDHGPGIAAADRERIFERFFRADSARTRGGSGLGLAIAHEIVAAHGGQIRFQARDPHGSVFSIELPANGR
jgi:heavy metal sensor kinase